MRFAELSMNDRVRGHVETGKTDHTTCAPCTGSVSTRQVLGPTNSHLRVPLDLVRRVLDAI